MPPPPKKSVRAYRLSTTIRSIGAEDDHSIIQGCPVRSQVPTLFSIQRPRFRTQAGSLVETVGVPKLVGETTVAPPRRNPKTHKNLLHQAMRKASPIRSP